MLPVRSSKSKVKAATAGSGSSLVDYLKKNSYIEGIQIDEDDLFF